MLTRKMRSFLSLPVVAGIFRKLWMAAAGRKLRTMEAQDFIRREKVSGDDRLKKVLPTRHTVEMKEQVERHITLLEKRLTAGIGAEELEIFSDVLKKMQENMELTEKGAGYG